LGPGIARVGVVTIVVHQGSAFENK
jgi:hypothetical protein